MKFVDKRGAPTIWFFLMLPLVAILVLHLIAFLASYMPWLQYKLMVFFAVPR